MRCEDRLHLSIADLYEAARGRRPLLQQCVDKLLRAPELKVGLEAACVCDWMIQLYPENAWSA